MLLLQSSESAFKSYMNVGLVDRGALFFDKIISYPSFRLHVYNLLSIYEDTRFEIVHSFVLKLQFVCL